MEVVASLYVVGSIAMAIVLIADNVLLIRRHGVADTTENGKAVGWTFFFMITEIWWAGTSVWVLWKGLVPPLVPVFYLALVGVALLSGVVINALKGPVLSFPVWQMRANLAFSVVFGLIAVYELVRASGANDRPGR